MKRETNEDLACCPNTEPSVSQGDLEEAVLLVTDEAAAAEKKALFGNVETKGGRWEAFWLFIAERAQKEVTLINQFRRTK